MPPKAAKSNKESKKTEAKKKEKIIEVRISGFDKWLYRKHGTN